MHKLLMAGFLSGMDACILVWLILIILFIVGELATVGLTSIWFAVGALVALISAFFGAPFGLQIVLFIAVSLIALAATRPLANKFINRKVQSTNAQSLIGQEIRIKKQVSNIDQTGMAVVQGQEWTVRSADDDVIIAQGELARIKSISGVKLIVEKIN
ncbi:MAG: NfeD family protein [Agathobacter sp.]|nr:NfeD family protein [Agathobacter sp.]